MAIRSFLLCDTWGGGVGGDNMDVAFAHLVPATQHMWWGVGWGVITSVALAHLVDATQHIGVVGGVGGDNIRCTCTLG